MLGQAGHERVQRAVRVRCLCGAPQIELRVDGVELRNAAARLHRSRVHARVDHVLGHHHIGLVEHGVGGVLVARVPVEDVVVGLALDVGPDHRRVRVERLAGVHHGGQYLVVDVDQLERVAG